MIGSVITNSIDNTDSNVDTSNLSPSLLTLFVALISKSPKVMKHLTGQIIRIWALLQNGIDHILVPMQV